MCYAASFVQNEVGKLRDYHHLVSSLFNDRPGSLVGGVRSCDELPKLESCLCCSSDLGFRLKKLLILPDVVSLPGLWWVGDDVADSGFGDVVSMVGSL